MEHSTNSCRFRHKMYPDVDGLKMLDLNKLIPDEGFIKFVMAKTQIEFILIF